MLAGCFSLLNTKAPFQACEPSGALKARMRGNHPWLVISRECGSFIWWTGDICSRQDGMLNSLYLSAWFMRSEFEILDCKSCEYFCSHHEKFSANVLEIRGLCRVHDHSPSLI